MKTYRCLLITISLIMLSTAAFSATYYVNGTTGDDTYDGLAAVWDGTHGPKKKNSDRYKYSS